MDTVNFKIVLLGEGCVGKTSITLRYCQNKFNDTHQTTIQASFLRKRLPIGNQMVNLAIWDTAGQERFHALGPIYYRDADGALLVYDVSDRDSFAKVQMWVKELRKMLGTQVTLAIAGNKIDLQRNVPLEEAEAYARSVGAVHFSTSAKLNQGIDDLFMDVAKRMLTARAAKEKSSGNSGRRPGGGGRPGDIVIGSEPTPPPRDDGCGC